jgi:hypothetical protein
MQFDYGINHIHFERGDTMKYDWKLTAKKFGWSALIVIVSGLIVYWQNDVKYIALIPFLTALLDWLKHRN